MFQFQGKKKKTNKTPLETWPNCNQLSNVGLSLQRAWNHIHDTWISLPSSVYPEAKKHAVSNRDVATNLSFITACKKSNRIWKISALSKTKWGICWRAVCEELNGRWKMKLETLSWSCWAALYFFVASCDSLLHVLYLGSEFFLRGAFCSVLVQHTAKYSLPALEGPNLIQTINRIKDAIFPREWA